MTKENSETKYNDAFKNFIKTKKKIEDNVNSLKDKIIGMTSEDAQNLASEKCIHLRIMKRDGKSLIGTRDLRMDRINLTVENNIIVETKVG